MTLRPRLATRRAHVCREPRRARNVGASHIHGVWLARPLGTTSGTAASAMHMAVAYEPRQGAAPTSHVSLASQPSSGARMRSGHICEYAAHRPLDQDAMRREVRTSGRGPLRILQPEESPRRRREPPSTTRPALHARNAPSQPLHAYCGRAPAGLLCLPPALHEMPASTGALRTLVPQAQRPSALQPLSALRTGSAAPAPTDPPVLRPGPVGSACSHAHGHAAPRRTPPSSVHPAHRGIAHTQSRRPHN